MGAGGAATEEGPGGCSGCDGCAQTINHHNHRASMLTATSLWHTNGTQGALLYTVSINHNAPVITRTGATTWSQHGCLCVLPAYHTGVALAL